MCGIVGYIGSGDGKEILLSGLTRLEYRGYDSAGIALLDEKGKIKVKKAKGKIADLRVKVKDSDQGTIGIGHTRWATHGEPSFKNSHPHLSENGTFCVVHNGIIENYLDLKEELRQKGVTFASETDTEVIPNLLEIYDTGDLLSTVQTVIKKLEGSYAICVLKKNNPNEMVVVRKASPLVIGAGQEEFFVASDIPAILEYTKDVYILEEGEMALVTRQGISFCNEDGTPCKKEVTKITWNMDAAEKQGYPHFMLKEIFEQPEAIEKTLCGRIKDGKVDLDLHLDPEFVKNIDKVSIVACGTASYAGRVGGHLIEKYLRIPVEAEFASEFRYKDPILTDKSLVLVVSQSGETADTLAGLDEAKKKGAKVVAVTNVVGSSIARNADEVILTQAGPEIAVASTKAYTTQLAIFYLLTLYLGRIRGNVSEAMEQEWTKELNNIPHYMETCLGDEDIIKNFGKQIRNKDDVFFLGRGVDSITALEGALKLKEISYIHAEAYAAGELKHGTLALITKGVPVISLATQSYLLEKMVSNIVEVKARGAVTYGIGIKGRKGLGEVVDYLYEVPEMLEALAPIVTVVPLQLLSYYTSVLLGNDVDKPRNLAKSVTVE